MFTTVSGNAPSHLAAMATYTFADGEMSRATDKQMPARLWVAVQTEFKRRVYGISIPEGMEVNHDTLIAVGQSIWAWQERNEAEGLIIPLRGAWGLCLNYGDAVAQKKWFNLDGKAIRL